MGYKKVSSTALELVEAKPQTHTSHPSRQQSIVPRGRALQSPCFWRRSAAVNPMSCEDNDGYGAENGKSEDGFTNAL